MDGNKEFTAHIVYRPLCGSGRFPALPCSPQRHCVEYSKMLLPRSDKSMKSGSPTIFGTIKKGLTNSLSTLYAAIGVGGFSDSA
jgi:hypothetical protein